ncbi:hypothetical protein SAMN04487943_1167 [Gracilibacillus orientalis]|uniref:AP2/ERF domain-containing protein n=1 Tax=Gracilibacillus orientalis TaxID=334253 RepID=A0A1I4QDN8_9BACI|nr:hypothetical protein [Gracilibacillus orientalis]SFM38159.1 hypothetical protein SAMN04487943_1167 [Gracilibacillus orientalis]
MLILPQTIIITWVGSNRSYYEERGYHFTSYHDTFKVSVLDLPVKSNKKVKVLCDYCNEIGIKREILKNYSGYNSQRLIVEKDACNDCQQLKREDIFLNKYNVMNPSHLSKVTEKIANKRRTSLYKVKEDFLKQGFNLLSNRYINDRTPLKFLCTKHTSLGTQFGNYKSVLENRLICKGCLSDKKSLNTAKEKNPMWKGGTRKLNTHLRDILVEWKKQSFKSCNYKCIVTGERNPHKLTIHHLYSFHKIVKEALLQLKLYIKENIGLYSKKELNLIEQRVIELHKKYPLGVVLKKTIHNHFHSIYRSSYSTPEQFIEYLAKNYEGQHNLSIKYSEKHRRYFPPKYNRSSSFHGVTYVNKQKRKYLANIKQNGSTIYIGSYETEIEAAYFFNQKAIELRGEHTTLNYLTEKEKSFVEERIKNGFYISNKKTKYKNVKKRGKHWECSFHYKNKLYYVGYFKNDKEAALAYNNFITKNKFNKPLNII